MSQITTATAFFDKIREQIESRYLSVIGEINKQCTDKISSRHAIHIGLQNLQSFLENRELQVISALYLVSKDNEGHSAEEIAECIQFEKESNEEINKIKDSMSKNQPSTAKLVPIFDLKVETDKVIKAITSKFNEVKTT